MKWRENISYIASLLEDPSTMISAKALRLLGKMGLLYPADIQPFISQITSFLDSQEVLCRS